MVWDQFKWAIDVFLNPEKRTVKVWKVEEAMKMYYRVAIIPLVILILGELFVGGGFAVYYSSILGRFGGTLGALGLTGSIILVTLLGYLLLVPIGLLISAWFINWTGHQLKTFKKNDFKTTLSALVYGACAWVAFSWIPFVSWFTGLWSVLVTIIALTNLQKTSSYFATFMTWAVGSAVLVIIYGVILLIAGIAFPSLWLPHP